MQSETEPYVITATDARAAVAGAERHLRKAREELQQLADCEIALPANTDEHDRDRLRRRIGWARMTVRDQEMILAGLRQRLAALEPA